MTLNNLSRCIIILILVNSLQTVEAETEFPDRLELLNLLKAKQFSVLNERLSAYQSAYEQGTGDEQLVAYFIETFANSDPEVGYILNEWVAIYPHSYIPLLIRGNYYYGVAWSWRGHQLRKDTPANKLLLMQEYLQLAAEDLTRAVELKSGLSAAYALAIRILVIIGSPELKKQALAEALADDPASYLVRSSYLWGLKPKWGGENTELLEFIDESTQYQEVNPLLQLLMGYADYIHAESLMDEANYEEAKTPFNSAIQKGANHEIYRERGINNYQLKEYEQALADFDISLLLWPQNGEVLRWRARTLHRLGRDDEALEDLDYASQLAPYNRYIQVDRASLLRKYGRLEDVLVNYDRALFYNYLDAEIWFARGMHYYRDLLDFQSAAGDLKIAAELTPEKAHYWYQYSAVLHYNNDCDIVVPLDHYLSLCNKGYECEGVELEWANKAREWLQNNNRCPVAADVPGR